MVTTLQDVDRPEPWLKTKKPIPPTTRETRTTAKASARNEGEEEAKAPNLPGGSGRGRKKGKAKRVEKGKGMKKTKGMPPATLDVVLGKASNTVRSVEELNRKTEEDARACGRITRTVSKPASQKSCPTTGASTIQGDQNDTMSPPEAHVLPCTSPTVLPVEVHTGSIMNIHQLYSAHNIRRIMKYILS